MTLFRVAAAPHAALDGEGARVYGSRWTPKGRAAIFTSATLSLAALERLVHLDLDVDATNLIVIAIDVDPAIAVTTTPVEVLPGNWRAYPPPRSLRAIGERWLRESETALLSVPSAVIPCERNFILNPAHRDFMRLVVAPTGRFTLDPPVWAVEWPRDHAQR